MLIPVAIFAQIDVPEGEDEAEIAHAYSRALARVGAELTVVGWEVLREEAADQPA